MTQKSNEEKSKVIAKEGYSFIIASKLNIKISHMRVLEGWKGTPRKEDFIPTNWTCTCGDRDCIKKKINFFEPEGQVVLAGALLEDRNRKVIFDFSYWLDNREISYTRFNGSFETEVLLTTIAETKLAELFFEFIESEEK